MTNEEKILQILEELRADVKRLDDKTDRMDKSIVKLEAMPHQIQLIAEAQQHANEKLGTLQKSVDDVAESVAALDILHQIEPHD